MSAAVYYVIREEAAVQVGQRALFIQCLSVVKGLFRREVEKTVGLPLQGGEVVQFGHLFSFPLPRYAGFFVIPRLLISQIIRSLCFMTKYCILLVRGNENAT